MSSERGECEAEEKARYVLEAIAERRSIRSFTDKPVSLDDLTKLITAAKWARTWSCTYTSTERDLGTDAFSC